MTIRETLCTLGRKKSGSAHYYAQGQYLRRAGFLPGVFLALTTLSDGSLEIRRSEQPTDNRVSAKGKTAAEPIPVIDLVGKALERFGVGAELLVRVEANRIILSPSAVAERSNQRPKDGSAGSLFSGGGLLDQAATQAGFTPRFAVEIDDEYADIFQRNHPTCTMVNASVHQAVHLDLPSVELLTLGIPCQPWSAVRRSGDTYADKLPATAHPLGDMALWAFAIILKVNPRTVVIEQVPGFAASETAYALQGALTRTGYAVTTGIVNAADHGGFTARKRFVLIAQTPVAGQALPPAFPDPAPNTRPIGSILERIGPNDPAWFDAESKPWVFEHARKQAAKGNGFKMLVVQPTATAAPIIKRRYHAGQGDNPVLAHPTKLDTFRWFTVRETARLNGLPDSYDLGPTKTTAGEIVGQGVDVECFSRIIRSCTGRAVAVPLAA